MQRVMGMIESTAYGKYRYTYEEFIKICDEMKASDFDSSLYLR